MQMIVHLNWPQKKRIECVSPCGQFIARRHTDRPICIPAAFGRPLGPGRLACLEKRVKVFSTVSLLFIIGINLSLCILQQNKRQQLSFGDRFLKFYLFHWRPRSRHFRQAWSYNIIRHQTRNTFELFQACQSRS